MHFPFLIYCALLVATVFGLVLSVPSHATNCQFTSKRPFHVKGENGLIRRGHVLPQQAKQQLHLPRGGPEADKPGGKCPPPFGPLKGNRPMTGHCIHTTQQREGKASASSQSADSQNTEMLDTSPYNIENVVIVGTGLMGTGIAQVAIESGMKVTVVGRGQEKCEVARQKVFAGVQKSTKRRLAAESAEKQQQVMAAAMEALDFVSELDEADLAGADLVVEAVVENLKVKQKLFVDLESRVSERCLLVTNTSSFLLEDVSAKMDKCRQNFGGLHFFNPVPAMKLVEVVRGNDTSEEAYDALFRFCQRIGKTPVKCADSPGFIVNRLLIPYLADAMRLAESGNATPRDIDTAMRLGTGHPMGPFELMDYIGLDTMKFIMDGWHQRCPDDHRYTPCESLDKLVAAGKMGRKGGEGFYRYASK